MNRAIREPRRLGRLSALAVAVAVVGGVLTACTPTSSGGGSTSSSFCSFFDKVQDAPPTETDAVLVKTDVVALAQDTTVTGSSCTDANAQVDLDGATLAKGQEVTSQIGNTDSTKTAAITGSEINAGAPVLENLKLTALSAEIGTFGIRLRGNVAVKLSGVTSTIGFVGTLTNLNTWSVSLSSTAFTVPGITTTPATFSGTLSVKNGVPSLSLTAGITQAKIGDITVNGASLKLDATPTSTSASVTGAIKVGPSTASGAVDVTFDKNGAIVSAKADINAHLVGNMAGGTKKIDMTGSVKLEGNATQTVASFSGSGIMGDFTVNEANGQLTLAPNKATFAGKLDIAQAGGGTLRFNGSIVWDGSSAYYPTLIAEGNGEFSGTLDDGKTVSVAGSLSVEVVNGQLHSVVTGSFQVGTLKANGSAVVNSNGSTTTLELDAALVGAGFNANITGAVIITDGRAELVQIDGSVTGSVNMGDATLTGATFSVRSEFGQPLALSFSGGLKVGNKADVNGAFNATFGPAGNLLTLGGSFSGSLALNSWAVVPFSGSVVATSEQVTLTGQGAINFTNFPAAITFKGTFTSSLLVPTWSLTGSGRFLLGPIDVASARLTLSQTAGMTATRLGFYFSILGFPTYFEGNFYMKPAGGCDHVDITAGSLIAKLALVIVLPGAIGCSVNI